MCSDTIYSPIVDVIITKILCLKWFESIFVRHFGEDAANDSLFFPCQPPQLFIFGIALVASFEIRQCIQPVAY